MEEYCGSLIDYAKTFQIDSNQFSQLSLGAFWFLYRTESGTEIGNSLEFDFVVPPPHS